MAAADRALFARLTELVLAGQPETAVLHLPDGSLLDFPGYLGWDDMEFALQQATVERAAAQAAHARHFEAATFGVALAATQEAGVKPFVDEGQFVALGFDLGSDDVECMVMIQPIRVRGDVLEVQDVQASVVALEVLPPDTPGLILLHELARLAGYSPKEA